MRPRRDLLVLLALLATCALLSQLRRHPNPPATPTPAATPTAPTPQATPTARPSAPRPDVQPVLEAALHKLEAGRSRHFLIQTQTDIRHLLECPDKLDAVLWQALQQANPSPQPLPRSSTHPWITPAEASAIFKGRNGWETFYRRYPRAAGLARLSYPGFDASGTECVVYAAYQSEGLCGEGMLYRLKLKGKVWTVVQVYPIWIS